MRKTFRGYFRPLDSSEEKTWKDSIFAFDANILLNFYRYSDSTRKEFFRAIGKIKEQLWLPYQAGFEYLENRANVIVLQEKSYDEALKKIDELLASFEHTKQHPFVDEQFLEKTKPSFFALKNELINNKLSCSKRIYDDDIQDMILDLFEGRVGIPFSTERLTKIHEEGARRFQERIPPGYMDSKKADGEVSFAGKNRRFGDFIIWSEILNYGSEHDKDITFITDDRKEDWWRRAAGKTIGPRPELIQEYFETTGRSFEMYEAYNFFETSNRLLNIRIRPKAVEEIKRVSRRMANRIGNDEQFLFDKGTSESLHRLRERQRILENEKKSLDEEIDSLIELMKKTNSRDADAEFVKILADNLPEMVNKANLIRNELENIETELEERNHLIKIQNNKGKNLNFYDAILKSGYDRDYKS